MRKGSDDKFSNDEFGVEGPAWADGKTINEAIFCEEFLSKHKILFSGGSFFTTEGRVVDETPLKRMVFDDLKICAVANVPQKISNIVELLKIQALDENFAPETDRIHLQNGTLYIDGTFDESKSEIVRSRLPISYNPNAPIPKLWLSFLGELLYPEDIPTLQEFIGYCLIPSNKGQRMMVIKGNGGEGKSQIGAIMTTLFGSNMKDGSIGKISENRFARADLEHILICIDDDLRMEGLKHTNYVKSIVTAQGKMDLEKKNKQSYQGYMYARLLAFSNGDLQAMFDKSDGFFRRQLVLTTKDKNAERIDDPHIADKMREEIEGIFLWAFEGLQRLLSNNFQFTESERAISNRETVKRNNVNAVEFMESDGYFAFAEDKSITSKDLYEIYKLWCEENALSPMSSRSLSDFLIANENRYGIKSSNNVYNREYRRVRGFIGIEATASPFMNNLYGS